MFPEWRGALKTEFGNHESQGTFKVVDRPGNTRLIPLTWRLQTKTMPDGSVDKYKARLVAAGNQQPIDPNEVTSAPTTDQPIVKIILITALQFGWSIKQADVKAAYLHADLEQNVYARFPTHAQLHFDNFDPHKQCLKIEKSLYGLRVSCRNWYDHFAGKLRSINFQPLYTYETVFTRRVPTGIVILLLYVDDCKLTGSSEELIRQAFEDRRASGINLESLDDAHNFLGIHYDRTGKHTMTASRPPSPNNIQYDNLSNSNNPSYQYYLSEEILRTSASHPFPIRSIIGDIMFTALSVRPDLTFATTYLARKLQFENQATWNFTRKLQKYYASTSDLKLHLSGLPSKLDGFHVFCDSDYASDPISR